MKTDAEEAERARRFRREHPDRAHAIAARYAAKPEVKVHKALKKREYRAALKRALAEGDPRAREKWERYRVLYVLGASKARALAAGIPWDLTKTDVQPPDACECCGKAWGRVRSDRPSIDRVHPARGYVRGNVAVICCACNRRKQESTLEELRALVAYVERFS